MMDNVARALGPGIAPWHDVVQEMNIAQASVLIELRFPRENEKEVEKAFEGDLERLDLEDDYFMGEQPDNQVMTDQEDEDDFDQQFHDYDPSEFF